MASPTKRTSKAAYGGVFAALALIFSYVEVLVPLPVPVPGIKLGLANIVVVLALYSLGNSFGFAINMTRIFLAAALFGSPYSAFYALCGGLLSFAVMTLLKKTGLFSVMGVSMAGGFAHNLGQLIAAAFITQTPGIMAYFSVLSLSGMATGIFNGIIAALVLQKVRL